MRDTKTMSKKKAVNWKAEAARARKAAVEADRRDREARQREDTEWQEAEGTMSRRAQKRAEKDEKRDKAAARKAETRRLAQQEEEELEMSLKKPVKKVTEAELRQRREERLAAIQKSVEEEKQKQSRIAPEHEYKRMVLVSNTNRLLDDDSVINANTIDEAIAQMTVTKTKLPEMIKNKHPLRKAIATQQGKKGNSLMRLARDDEERYLLKDVRRINLDRSSLMRYEDYSVDDEEEFEDSYGDDYQQYDDKYYN